MNIKHKVVNVLFSHRKVFEINFFWEEYGFTLWEWHDLRGFYRKVTFKKDSLMGEIARYYAYDYVIFSHQGLASAQKILEQWKPIPDVMTQRVLLVTENPALTHTKMFHKSFLFGFRGWIDLFFYHPEDKKVHRKFSDLATLVRNALVVSSKISDKTERREAVKQEEL